MSDMPWRSLRLMSRFFLRRADLRVEGLERIPKRGPVVIAARHYHHLYDGCALLATINRPTHALVAIDWANRGVGRTMLEKLCASARWPMVIRPPLAGQVPDPDGLPVLRRSAQETVELLREGRVVVIFPEGYPTIDPGVTPKSGPDEFLPFQAGVVKLARMASTRDRPVTIVPAGFAYEEGDRWQIDLRFGEPIRVSPGADATALLNQIEAEVIRLSARAE